MKKINSFRNRILAALLIVAYASVSLFLLVIYRSAARLLQDNYVNAKTAQLRVQLDLLDEQLGMLYRTAVRTSQDTSFMQAISNYLSISEPQMEDVIILNQELQARIDDSEANLMYLYLPARSEIICSDEMYMQCDVKRESEYSWITSVQSNSFSPVFFYDGNTGSMQNYYGYSKPLFNSSGELAGVVYIALDERKLFYELIDRAGDGDYFLCDDQGKVYSATQRDSISEEATKFLNDLDHMPDTSFNIMNEQLVVSVSASFSGMHLISLSDRSVLQSRFNNILGTIYALMIVIILLAMLVAKVMQRWLYQPISSLMEDMDRAGEGDLSVHPGRSLPLEFKTLSERFNHMLEQINGLLDSLLEERMAKRQAELHALQYQIRPHFMYNTLNSIKYAAILQGNEKIGEQIGAFVALLEASINKNGAFIKVEDEVALLENYISLQKYRYLDCFEVIYSIDSSAKDCYVPKLILQTLVENSILHGMDTKREGNIIQVAAMLEGNMLWLAVNDNGMGMTEEEQQRLLDSKSDDHRQFTGIGVANIRERIKLYYGEKGHFRLVSAPGQGASIVLELPASWDEGEYAI